MELNQRGLFLHGSQGRGKTVIATAILRYELTRLLKRESPYRSIQFMFIPDLVLELQSCFAPGSDKIVGDVIYRVADYDFLVLDGAGEGGRPSEFVIGAMGTLIHHREAVRKTKRTVITSNYSIQDLGERMDARITSRIAGMCEEIPFTGKDRRLRR
jgi:DNA replication protein DnaC